MARPFHTVLRIPSQKIRAMEHRWGRRITLDLPAIVAHGERRAAARLCDASLSGGFVATRMRLPLWSQVEVRLVPVMSGQSAAAIPAAVVRARHDGLGIEWCEFAPEEIRELLARLPTTPGATRQPKKPGHVRYLPPR